ncbi:MAG: hypothetical protein KDK08_27640 [Rhizobiaceae bacterium]|nr:hypothetical protein [Rhizobiaceae bacterium]
MRRPNCHCWPERLPLDGDASIPARKPEAALAAIVTVLQGVCPDLKEDHLRASRAGALTADWLRQCTMYLLVGRLGHTLAVCSKLLNRDRASVRHGVYRVTERVENSVLTAQFLDFVEAQLAIELRRVLYEGGF